MVASLAIDDHREGYLTGHDILDYRLAPQSSGPMGECIRNDYKITCIQVTKELSGLEHESQEL